MSANQLGFLMDSTKCVQCHACQVACKATHDLELGIQLRHVLWNWQGEPPQVEHLTVSIACLHCENPLCIKACRSKAITKREQDGAVVVDRAKCDACGKCALACPYGAPQFSADGKMIKCDLCTERREHGLEPACVATCPTEALLCGEMEQLQQLAEQRLTGRLSGRAAPAAFFVMRSPSPTLETFLRRAAQKTGKA